MGCRDPPATPRKLTHVLPEHRHPTPQMTPHARARCAEMGICTKVAKRIWQNRTVTYRGSTPGSRVALSTTDSRYAVVYRERPGEPDLIVTVLFNQPDRYVRNGTTFIITERGI
jgi:hypothetical protein